MHIHNNWFYINSYYSVKRSWNKEISGTRSPVLRAAKKLNRALGIIKKRIENKTENITMPLYNPMVHPYLESYFKFWFPHLQKVIVEVENIQRRAARMIGV